MHLSFRLGVDKLSFTFEIALGHWFSILLVMVDVV